MPPAAVHGFISVGDILLLAATGLAVHDLLTRSTPKPPPGGSRRP